MKKDIVIEIVKILIYVGLMAMFVAIPVAAYIVGLLAVGYAIIWNIKQSIDSIYKKSHKKDLTVN